MKAPDRLQRTIMALVAAVALLAGLFVAQHWRVKPALDPEQFNGTVLQQARVLAPFELTGVDHQVVNNASVRGQWTLLFFGFTHCASVCPTSMAELGKTYRLLQQRGVKPLPQVMMVTLDPQRDSLERLGRYVRAFDQHFYGARGTEEQTQALTAQLGIAYAKLKDIEHTGTILLLNPKGQLQAFFTTPHQADKIAHDYSLLLA